MENSYAAPSSDMASSTELRRPFGVAVLSVLTGILGLILLAAFVVCVLNWRENNEYFLRQRMAPSIFWFYVVTGVAMAFAASVGIWKGTKWGWWITCCGLVMFFLQNVVQAAIVNLSQGSPSMSIFVSLESLKYVVRGIIFAPILVYWLRTRVRRHFRVEKTGPIKAVVLVALCGIGGTFIVTLVLQFLFIYSMR